MPRPLDRADGRAGSQRFRNSKSRSPLRAVKRIAIEEPNRPPGSNTGARDPSETSLAHTRNSSKFNLTKDSPALQQPETHDLGQPTKELKSLGEDNSVTDPSGCHPPDNNVLRPRGREESLEGKSRSSDSRSSSRRSLCSQREGNPSRFGEPGVLPVLRYEMAVPKLEPDDLLPDSTSADWGLYLNAGTSSGPCEWDPGSAPKASTWRTTDFTPPICELVHGKARQARNRASAALLPDDVPLFGPSIRASRTGGLRPQKAKFKGSLEEYYQMLSDNEKKEQDDNQTSPTVSREGGDLALSSSSEEEDYDLTYLKNPRVTGAVVAEPKSQLAPPAEKETQDGPKNSSLTRDTLCASCVPSDSTPGSRLNEAKNDPVPPEVQQEKNPPKSEDQTGSESVTLAKGDPGPSGVPDRSTHSIAPTKKLALARGKQLRPELAQALALLRDSSPRI